MLSCLRHHRGDEEELAAARKRTLSPENRSALEAKVTEFWKVWVEAWRGQTLKTGEQVPGVTAIPLGEETVEASTVLRHLGENEGNLHLTLQIELRGEKPRKAFQSFLRGLKPGSKPEVQVFPRSTRLEVLTNPDTLQPRLAAVEQIITLQIRGEKQGIRRQSREYTFRWIRQKPGGGR